MEDGPGEVTLLLRALERGDPQAESRIMPLVYAELRRLAAYYMRLERPGHTLQPTALVHEAYLRLVTSPGATCQNRAHFLAVAARAMRRVLVDHARERGREKRGGAARKLSLDEALIFSSNVTEEILGLEVALSKLEDLDARQCRIVELRCFGGLTVEETSGVLHVSPTTIKREWNSAVAWLSHEMGSRNDAGPLEEGQ